MEHDNSERKPNLTFEKDHNNTKMSANTNISVSDKVKHDEHNTTQHIPIVVNGEVIETKNSKVELFNTDDKGSAQNTMSEVIMELTNKRNSYSVNKKHKIICIGDTHKGEFINVVLLQSPIKISVAYLTNKNNYLILLQETPHKLPVEQNIT